MNRRGFLGLLGAAASAALIGELPSSKTFFLPPAGGWHPDQAKVDAAFRAWVTEIAESMRHTKEQVMADVINRGFGMARIKPEGGAIAYEHVPICKLDVDPASFEDMAADLRGGADYFVLDEPLYPSKSVKVKLSFGKQGVIHGQIEGEAARSVAGLEFRRTAQVLPDHRQEPRQSGAGSDRSRITGRTA